MTTLTPPADVALPEGADPENVDNWDTDNGVTSRLVWSLPDPSAQEFQCDVRIVGSQRLDGSFIDATDNPLEGPLVYIDGQDFSISDARSLALALITAVSLAEKWVAK